MVSAWTRGQDAASVSLGSLRRAGDVDRPDRPRPTAPTPNAGRLRETSRLAQSSRRRRQGSRRGRRRHRLRRRQRRRSRPLARRTPARRVGCRPPSWARRLHTTSASVFGCPFRSMAPRRPHTRSTAPRVARPRGPSRRPRSASPWTVHPHHTQSDCGCESRCRRRGSRGCHRPPTASTRSPARLACPPRKPGSDSR